MAKAKGSSGVNNKPKTTPAKKQTANKDLPASYYRGQDKRTKPQKDKNGDIIPG